MLWSARALHEWRPSLFLASPYVALLFSYVYAVCVLLGIWTRSTIAALMLAILFYATVLRRFDP